jgi:hypothetical protein
MFVLVYAEGNEEKSERTYSTFFEAYDAAMLPDMRYENSTWHIMLKPYAQSKFDKNQRLRMAWETEGLLRSFTIYYT